MAALADADQSTRLAGRNRLERAREYFEPYLDDMGLSISKLDQQTTDQLRDSLEKINQLIARPESLGVFREAFALLMASTETQVTALPALLQRKGYIIEKLREKGEEEKLVTLRDVIQKSVMNVEFKQEIETQLEALEKN